MTFGTTWRTGAALVVVLGLGMAGGQAGASAATPTPSASSAPVTTLAFSFAATVTGATGGPIVVSGKGQADLATEAAALTVTLPASVVALLPGGATGPETVKVVLSGGTVYLDVPSLKSLVGKPWLGVTLPSQATSALPAVSAAVASALGDVGTVVAQARAHGAAVTSLGTRRVNGTRATGDRIAVAVSAGSAGGTLTAALWQDSGGRLVQATVDAQGTGSAAAYGISGTVNVRKYGAPVSIVVPPANKVTTVPWSLVEQLLGSALHLPAAA
jgi:hypothetical protein